jgi:hypothetical protein
VDDEVHVPFGRAAGQGGPPGDRPDSCSAAEAVRAQPAGIAKTIEGKQHSDRDAQFRYIAARVVAYKAEGDPVISVDTKKKELVGNFATGGAEWEPAGDPRRVNVHDFADCCAPSGWTRRGSVHDFGGGARSARR